MGKPVFESPEMFKMPDSRPERVLKDATGERGMIVRDNTCASYTVLKSGTLLLAEGENIGVVEGDNQSGEPAKELCVRQIPDVDLSKSRKKLDSSFYSDRRSGMELLVARSIRKGKDSLI